MLPENRIHRSGKEELNVNIKRAAHCRADVFPQTHARIPSVILDAADLQKYDYATRFRIGQKH